MMWVFLTVKNTTNVWIAKMNIKIFCLFYIAVIALVAQLTIQYNIKIVNEHTAQKIAPAQNINEK